ncbi:uncharacterized protein A4U43_C08F21450, partial [Asparagus officinalis]
RINMYLGRRIYDVNQCKRILSCVIGLGLKTMQNMQTFLRIAQMLTVRREWEIEEGINKRLSRKLGTRNGRRAL